MFEIRIDYPKKDEEVQIVLETTAPQEVSLHPVLSAAQVLEIQKVVRKIPVSEAVIRFAVDLVDASRPKSAEAPDFVKMWVRWGAGPRSSQFLILAAKARSAIRGNFAASAGDVEAVAPLVLRHRIITNFHAESEGVTADEIVKKLLEQAKRPS